MKKLLAAIAVSTLLTACVFATNQPPEGKGPPGGGGRKGQPGAGEKGKGGPGRFELGRLLPGPMREELGLSEEQANLIDALEKDVKERLNKILTDDQKQKLNDLGRRGPMGPRFGGGDDKFKGPPPGDDNRPRGKGEPGQRKGPPPGDDDRPRGKGNRGEKKGPPPPPRIDDDGNHANAGGIQWFGTLERGLAEARRTGQPILFVAAAPHCGGVPGIW